ncbi:guanylate kinase [Blattabacterium cuenoti]|uniref:guanylate kinase n=1 Tax=Blattabacterium cuenoti TaxID=1653831 RepID=UPI00163B75B3|nr:guanylate kinase [Blattabacterium cuenoti]
MKKEKIIIISGPSGSGKTTISHFLLSKIPDLELSISCTTRKKRNYEKHGKDYYFISIKTFFSKIKTYQFIEWEEVYKQQFYGTLKSEIYRIWNKKKIILFDVDVKGSLNIKKQYPNNSLSIFIMVKSINILKNRLFKRKYENSYNIDIRLKKAKQENNFSHLFDSVLLNDDILKTKMKIVKLIESFI